jgi:hypothetical protein
VLKLFDSYRYLQDWGTRSVYSDTVIATMPYQPRQAPDDMRTELAHALGFPEYPTSTIAEPYLNYIANRYVGRGTLEGYLKLVIHVIEYFKAEGDEDALSARYIQELLDSLATSSDEYFSDTKAGSQTRHDDVEDTILYIIGTWTLLVSSFVHLPVAGGARKIALAYSIRAQDTPSASQCHPYKETVSGLIIGSGLLPAAGQWGLPNSSDDNTMSMKAAIHFMETLRGSQSFGPGSASSPGGSTFSLQSLDSVGRGDTRMSLRYLDDLDSLESLHIANTRLNAYTLSVFGAVDVAWTHNISRHMLLCKRGNRHVLEVFALPCALSATTLTSRAVGITPEYAQEVMESYSLLFNAWSDTPRHAKYGKFFDPFGFCWCWSCSARRYRTQVILEYRKLSKKRTPGSKRCRSSHASEFDPLLLDLMENEPSDWTPEFFPSLWSRIMILEEHLQAAKPWNIWVLFRDRRDTLQFWTFL